jgi:hypothetical protein
MMANIVKIKDDGENNFDIIRIGNIKLGEGYRPYRWSVRKVDNEFIVAKDFFEITVSDNVIQAELVEVLTIKSFEKEEKAIHMFDQKEWYL